MSENTCFSVENPTWWRLTSSGDLANDKLLCSTPRVCSLVDLWWDLKFCISNKFPVAVAVVGP